MKEDRTEALTQVRRRLLGEGFDRVFEDLAEGLEPVEQQGDFARQLHFLALTAGYEPTTEAGKLFAEAYRVRHAPKVFKILRAALLSTELARTRFSEFTAMLIAARGAISRDRARFASAFGIPEEALERFETGSTHPGWFSRETAASIASLLGTPMVDWDAAVRKYSGMDPFMYPPHEVLSESWLRESWRARQQDWGAPSDGLFERSLNRVILPGRAMAAHKLLVRVPLFSGVRAEELDGLAALLRRHRYAATEIIFHEGDAGTALYIIEKGEVKVTLGSAEGKEVVLSLLGPGDFFGELAIFDGEPRSADAVAMETSELWILQRHDFLRFVAEQPQIAVNLLAMLSRRLRQTDQLVHDAAFLDVRARLVMRLLNLAQMRGQAGPEGVVIASRLTQSDLANMVGATRESINKWLRYYAKKGLVRHHRGRLTLLDLKRLREDIY